MAALMAGQETDFKEVSRQETTFRDLHQGGPRTVYHVEERKNYKERIPAQRDTTSEHIDLSTTAARPIQVDVSEAQQAELPINRVKGVVERVDQTLSQVTLFYADRENSFLFPTTELESAGAAYVGALFEVIVAKDGKYTGYTLAHLKDEEGEARRELSSADLSFLDE